MCQFCIYNSLQNLNVRSCFLIQVFVANPRKPPSIVKILLQNRSKLLAFLEEFHFDKGLLFLFVTIHHHLGSYILKYLAVVPKPCAREDLRFWVSDLWIKFVCAIMLR
jgi:hypothetical protein